MNDNQHSNFLNHGQSDNHPSNWMPQKRGGPDVSINLSDIKPRLPPAVPVTRTDVEPSPLAPITVNTNQRPSFSSSVPTPAAIPPISKPTEDVLPPTPKSVPFAIPEIPIDRRRTASPNPINTIRLPPRNREVANALPVLQPDVDVFNIAPPTQPDVLHGRLRGLEPCMLAVNS